MVALDNSVQLVSLRFRFPNWDAIPSCMEHLFFEGIETSKHRPDEATYSRGELVIAPTKSCSVVGAKTVDSNDSYG